MTYSGRRENGIIDLGETHLLENVFQLDFLWRKISFSSVFKSQISTIKIANKGMEAKTTRRTHT
jgi:hypothetical protein